MPKNPLKNIFKIIPKSGLFIGLLTAILTITAVPAEIAQTAHAAGQTITWTGDGGNDYWHTATNWSPRSVPTSADTVTISGGSSAELVSGQVANFTDLTISGTSTTFILTGNIEKGTDIIIQSGAILEQRNQKVQTLKGALTIESGGKLTHTFNGTNDKYAVSFSAENITVAGQVNVDSKGYKGGSSSSPNGGGIGKGKGKTNGYGGGAGYGGKGGPGAYNSNSAGIAYGDTEAPEIGSGGGAGKQTNGGAGGGLIKLHANNTFSLTGNMYARGGAGGSGSRGTGGGGSGGGIKITAYYLDILSGSRIYASGGRGGKRGRITFGGGGGGGRIYLGHGELQKLGYVSAGAGYSQWVGSQSGPVLSEQIFFTPPTDPDVDYGEAKGIPIINKTPIGNIQIYPPAARKGIANPGILNFDYEDPERCDDDCGTEYAGIAAHLIIPEDQDQEDPDTYEWRGWALSKNIGWVSFYCGEEPDYEGEGFSNMGIPCGEYEFGIIVDAVTGEFLQKAGDEGDYSPYAWNPATGYIQFNNADDGELIPYSVEMDTQTPVEADLGLFIEESTGGQGEKSWAYSDSLSWIEFTGVQALISGLGEPVPEICDPDKEEMCVEVTYDGDIAVADGVDHYKVHLYLYKDVGGGDKEPLTRNEIESNEYEMKVTFNWHDTIRRMQVSGEIDEVSDFCKSGTNTIETLDACTLSMFSQPIVQANNGGVLYKPVVLKTYEDDVYFESDDEYAAIGVPTASYQDITNAFEHGYWASDHPNENEYILEVKSLAPSTTENYALTTGQQKDIKVLNNDFGNVPVHFDPSTLPGKNKVELRSVRWELEEVSSGDMTGGSFFPVGNTVELKYKPALEVFQMDASGPDTDSIFAYRGIPVQFKIKGKDNRTDTQYVKDARTEIELNLYYDKTGDNIGFDFRPTEEYYAAEDDITGTENESESQEDKPFEKEHLTENLAAHYKAYLGYSDIINTWIFEARADLDTKDELPRDFVESGSLYSVINSRILKPGTVTYIPISYYSNKLPRRPGTIANPAAKILGNIFAQLAFSPQKTDRVVKPVGDTNVNIVRDTVYANVQKVTRGKTAPARKDTFTFGSFEVKGECIVADGCLRIEVGGNDTDSFDEEIWYVNADEVIIDNHGEATDWAENTTLVVNGGNVFIKNDLKNDYVKEGNQPGLGIIVFRDPADDIGESGNVYVGPEPKNLRAVTIVADGTLFSYNGDEDDIDASTGEPVWDSDMVSILNKQLVIEGAISSRNTIGGGESYRLGTGQVLESTPENKIRAQLYDLNYLRFFRLKMEYDVEGNPIDQSCGKGLTSDDMATIAEGDTVTYTTGGTVETCDGINQTAAYEENKTTSGDLVITGLNELAEGGKVALSNPVFVRYMPPNTKSFIFSNQKTLTF